MFMQTNNKEIKKTSTTSILVEPYNLRNKLKFFTKSDSTIINILSLSSKSMINSIIRVMIELDFTCYKFSHPFFYIMN